LQEDEEKTPKSWKIKLQKKEGVHSSYLQGLGMSIRRKLFAKQGRAKANIRSRVYERYKRQSLDPTEGGVGKKVHAFGDHLDRSPWGKAESPGRGS